MDNIMQSIQYNPNGTITEIQCILGDCFAIESIEIMKPFCWIIVLSVIHHCTVLHNNDHSYYCRNPYQSITLMQVSVESALYNHHPNAKRILRETMDCVLNSNIAIFSLLCVY